MHEIKCRIKQLGARDKNEQMATPAGHSQFQTNLVLNLPVFVSLKKAYQSSTKFNGVKKTRLCYIYFHFFQIVIILPLSAFNRYLNETM